MNELPDDFRDLLVALADAEARFLLVGGYAVAFHGHARATKDLDVLCDPGPQNARRVMRALAAFGAPLNVLGIDRADLEQPGTIVQIGVPPLRIDLLTTADGIEFEDAWNSRASLEIDGRVVGVIGRAELLRNKIASGRHQDLADVEALEAIVESED